MGKTLGELADIARAAWMDCDLTGDHWAATAKALRSQVIEDAIEAVSKTGVKLTHPGNRDAEWFYNLGAKEQRQDCISALTALKDQSNDAS